MTSICMKIFTTIFIVISLCITFTFAITMILKLFGGSYLVNMNDIIAFAFGSSLYCVYKILTKQLR